MKPRRFPRKSHPCRNETYNNNVPSCRAIHSPAFAIATVSIHKIFTKMEFLTVGTFLFRVVLAQAKRCFGNNDAVGPPLSSSSRCSLSCLHYRKPGAFLDDVPKIVFLGAKALVDFTIELEEVHSSFVWAQHTGGMMNNSCVVRHFIGVPDAPRPEFGAVPWLQLVKAEACVVMRRFAECGLAPKKGVFPGIHSRLECNAFHSTSPLSCMWSWRALTCSTLSEILEYH